MDRDFTSAYAPWSRALTLLYSKDSRVKITLLLRIYQTPKV